MRNIVLAFAALVLLALGLQAPAPAQGLRTDEIGVTGSSGDVAAATATATLPAIQNAVTKICGFTVTGEGATAASNVAITVANVNQTTTFDLAVPVGATVALPPTVYQFFPCIPASAPNQTITVSMPSLGTGNTDRKSVV